MAIRRRCEERRKLKLYPITLCDDFSVITEDGEYLGTWDTDETDAFFQFYPEGATEPLFIDPFMGKLCEKVKAWHTNTPLEDDAW